MTMYSREKDYDLFEDEDDDSLSDAAESSSDNEIDIILHGTTEQRKKLQQSYRKKPGVLKPQMKTKLTSKSSSEDEFEKEMNTELNKHVQMLENVREQGSNKAICLSSHQSQEQMKSQEVLPQNMTSTKDHFYDEVYFDSDDEDIEKKHAVMSNDDLLYDPDMDDEDQKWVDQLRHHGNRQVKGKKNKNSDALLDCPACMTTLCLDCQRHEIYKNQYRAMFVMNCTVDTAESLQCPQQGKNKKKKKSSKIAQSGQSDPQIDQSGQSDPQIDQSGQTDPQIDQSGHSGSQISSDLFYPVKCNECQTVVGVMDKDEVYHFFNVLASHT